MTGRDHIDPADIPDGVSPDVQMHTTTGRRLLAQGDRGMARKLLSDAIDIAGQAPMQPEDRARVFVDAARVYADIATAEETH
jgi:hypothetical protein